MDMIYAVNKNELGINDILQLMIFLVGEGMNTCLQAFLELILILFLYIIKAFHNITNITYITSGHYGQDYPWHTRSVDALADLLRDGRKSLNKDQLIELSLILAKIRPENGVGFDKTIKTFQEGLN